MFIISWWATIFRDALKHSNSPLYLFFYQAKREENHKLWWNTEIWYYLLILLSILSWVNVLEFYLSGNPTWWFKLNVNSSIRTGFIKWRFWSPCIKENARSTRTKTKVWKWGYVKMVLCLDFIWSVNLEAYSDRSTGNTLCHLCYECVRKDRYQDIFVSRKKKQGYKSLFYNKLFKNNMI